MGDAKKWGSHIHHIPPGISAHGEWHAHLAKSLSTLLSYCCCVVSFSIIHLSIPSTHHRTRLFVFHRQWALPHLLPNSFPPSFTALPPSLLMLCRPSHTYSHAVVPSLSSNCWWTSTTSHASFDWIYGHPLSFSGLSSSLLLSLSSSHLTSSHLEENQFFLAQGQRAAAVSISSVSVG